jgi:hypothetical protein
MGTHFINRSGPVASGRATTGSSVGICGHSIRHIRSPW